MHRDVSPQNILVSYDGAIKLVDFGVASAEDARLTRTGAIIGTPAYMAPEQLQRRTGDARSDQFRRRIEGEMHRGAQPDDGDISPWPRDGGPFITLPNVITRDPDTGARNIGMYRMQVIDRRSTGMHWQVHKTGARHFRRARELGRNEERQVEPAFARRSHGPVARDRQQQEIGRAHV